MQPGFKRFIQSWLINTLAVLAAVFVVPGIHFPEGGLWSPFVTSLVLGILNAFIRPIMMFLALPLLIVTLGLFTLVINATLLYLVGLLLGSYFEVDGFGWALLGAIIISVVSRLLHALTGTGGSRVKLHHRPRRPPSDRNDGNGPVIDV